MKNQVLITIDSCRWDTFKDTPLPFLKRFPFQRCFTHGTFTLPAHQAFFSGRLPHNFLGRADFDTCGNRKMGRLHPMRWRLYSEGRPGKAHKVLVGDNIVEGWANLGHFTIGTGAMSWFDPSRNGTFSLLRGFKAYKFFPNPLLGNGTNLRLQVDWLLEQTAARGTKPWFLFLNIGETHQPYYAEGHELRGDWGNAESCKAAQRASLEYVDGQLMRLYNGLRNFTGVICSDHGDCWGEDDLWGHGFYHMKVIAVPMLMFQRD